ncbi:hypothetical protein [Pseudoalteromonas rubra]|uniref:hypothetical protein n=1 Tax=Pseudoalteromonas rubra TaxID=43658 RepID=UPI000F7970B7|nr:hypothetical protein [Pseudoalteromonas rubra]
MNIKYCVFIILSLLWLSKAFASPQNGPPHAFLGEVKIANNVVFFQAPPPDTDNLDCFDTNAPFQWAFSLNSVDGPSLYRAILAAQSGQAQLVIVPAGDCAAAHGLARPAAITLLRAAQ